MLNVTAAADAVLDAYSTEADRLDREVSDREMLAAALRGLVDHLGYYTNCDLSDELEVMYSEGWNHCLKDILHVADELEGVKYGLYRSPWPRQ